MNNKDEEISINLTEEQAEDFKKAFGLDELKEIHKRFENGTETIGDIKNHCLNYVIKNKNGLELRVVEVKYFEKLIKYIEQLEKQSQNLIEKLEEDIQKADSIINDEEFRYIQEVIDEQYERKKYAEEILGILEVQNEQ